MHLDHSISTIAASVILNNHEWTKLRITNRFAPAENPVLSRFPRRPLKVSRCFTARPICLVLRIGSSRYPTVFVVVAAFFSSLLLNSIT
jgi:hypothetical protein